MATTPVVTWTHKPDAADFADPAAVIDATSWDIGVVDAGDVSDEHTFLIWNNKGGGDDLAVMQDCNIDTRTLNGSQLEDNPREGQDVVQERWVQIDATSNQDAAGFEEVGFDDALNPPDGEFVKKNVQGWDADPYEINGDINDGSYDDGLAKGVFAEVIMRAAPPLNATSGLHQFLTRLHYHFT